MKIFFILLMIMIVVEQRVNGQLTRKEMKVPDIPGYETLKCDFHIHTVFSDGNVWPTVRVDEAWILGYDAISITDHIEYQPHKHYIPVHHNAGYEIAKPKGDKQDMIVIQGSEVTRVMPPGHLNAIFIEDASKIETERIRHMHASDLRSDNFMDSIDHQHQDYMLALEEALNQGGFIFWNHPGWSSQAPDGIKIYDVHKDLIERGWLKGIEVANWSDWYPEAFQWCLDYNIAMLSNSDIHQTEGIYEMASKVNRRPVTLVFATERTADGILDALNAARTAVWFNDLTIGKEIYLGPLFDESIKTSAPFFIDQDGKKYFNIKNTSDFLFTMVDSSTGETLELLPESTTILTIEAEEKERIFEIKNFLIEPEKPLEITISFD